MPTELSWFCRLVWMASLALALVADAEAETQYRWWVRCLAATLLFSPLYWPELTGWTDTFWPAILALAVLRVVAVVEAFHFHTRKFLWWSGLSASVFTMAFTFTGLVHILKMLASFPTLENTRDAGVTLSAYCTLWCAFTMLVNGLIFLRIGGWRRRREDFHALVVTLVCLAHGASALAHVAGPPGLASWRLWDPAVTLWDACLYLAWAVGVTLPPPLPAFGRALSIRRPSRRS